jgi:pilus assembly protein Flp/PilA
MQGGITSLRKGAPADAGRKKRRTPKMNNVLLKLYVKTLELLTREEGQDLVEYALIIALIALGSIVAINSLSAGLNTIFNNISTSLA